MGWVPLNYAPLRWRSSVLFETGPEDVRAMLSGPSSEGSADSYFLSIIQMSLKILNGEHQIIFDLENADIVLYENVNSKPIEIIRGKFWAIGSNDYQDVPSIWKLNPYSGIIPPIRQCWKNASNEFVKAAFLRKCITSGIRKNDLNKRRVEINPNNWRFETPTYVAPERVQMPDGQIYDVPNYKPLSYIYFKGPNIDWKHNSLTSLDGEEWIDVQVAESGSLVSGTAGAAQPTLVASDNATRDSLQNVKPSPTRSFSETKAKEAYQRHVSEWPSDKRPPSRDEDIQFMKTCFPGISRDKVRELRNEFAPSDWKNRGRRYHRKLAET